MDQGHRTLEIYPAIDIRGGKVVRLREGDPARQTLFDDDPRATARRWIEQGTRWLHVVNLDGAFAQEKLSPALVAGICALGARVQFGGGIRALDDIQAALDCGVARVVLGTLAVEQPEVVEQAVARFGADQVAVGIDARTGSARVRGWQSAAGVSAIELAQRVRAVGVARIVYTEIERDGLLSGANVESAARLAEASGLRVIVSGGVATLDDIRRARGAENRGIEGVIIGRALYEGVVSLRGALASGE